MWCSSKHVGMDSLVMVYNLWHGPSETNWYVTTISEQHLHELQARVLNQLYISVLCG